MTNICPRPCSRLATAAVFITVGVVQLIVGIILLKSKYVYLLAGPDFWTASSNIVVGSLLGISASVWRRLKRGRSSAKYAVRRNVVSALMLSALVINATTAILLILGEGHTLLSIQLENNGKNQAATFAGEILAYAFAASVCSPILCVVIALVFLAGNCFQLTDDNKGRYVTPENVSDSHKRKKDVSDSYKWVYTPEKADYHESNLNYSQSSCSDDSPLPANPAEDEYIDALYACALYKMAKARRSRSLSDATIYRQRKPKYLRNCSSHKSARVSFPDLNESMLQRSNISTHHLNRTYLVSPLHNDFDLTPMNMRGQGTRAIPCVNQHEFQKGRHNLSEGEVFCDLPLNLVMKKEQSESKTHNTIPKQFEESSVYAAKNDECFSKILAEVHDGSNKQSYDRGSSSEVYSKKISPYSSTGISNRNYSNALGAKRALHNAMTKPCVSQYQTRFGAEPFSPNCSDLGDSVFDVSEIALAGDVIPIRINPSSIPKAAKMVPASIPVVPNCYELKNYYVPELQNKRSMPSEPRVKISRSMEEEKNKKQMEKGAKDTLSSFQMHLGNTYEELPLDCTRESFIKQGRNLESTSNVSPMTPILEHRSEESKHGKKKIPSTQTSGYESSSEESRRTPTKSEAVLKKLYEEDSECDDMVTPKKLVEISNGESTPKRKNSSPKHVFRKFWSSAGAEAKKDFLDQIVDGDSLIGLTEQDLIMRQLRNRSLRKIVERRMKEQKQASEYPDESSLNHKLESEV